MRRLKSFQAPGVLLLLALVACGAAPSDSTRTKKFHDLNDKVMEAQGKLSKFVDEEGKKCGEGKGLIINPTGYLVCADKPKSLGPSVPAPTPAPPAPPAK